MTCVNTSKESTYDHKIQHRRCHPCHITSKKIPMCTQSKHSGCHTAELRPYTENKVALNQWFSTVLILGPFSAVPHVVVTPTTTK